MRKLICLVCMWLAAFPLFGQASGKYEVGTITDVRIHPGSGSDVVSYDVSIKVGGTTYLVFFTPPVAVNTVKYAAGRQLLVLVGEKTITYNEILGQSVEVPIVGQTSADKRSK